MKRKLIVIVAILLLVPIVIYFAFPEVLYNFSISSARKSAGLSKKIIEVDNHTISYLEGGKGDTILMLHGFGGNKDHWTKFAKSLTTNFHVIAIDLPGFGESSKIETESYNIDSQVKRLRRIVDVLGLNKFHLVGNSMGGTIAGRYTAVVPDKVLSLALFDTGGIPSAEKSEYIKLLYKGENPLLIESSQDFDKMMELAFEVSPPIPKRIKAYLTKQAILNREFNEKVFKEIVTEMYSLESDLSKIRVNTLILWGDKDRILHVSSTNVLEKGLPDSTTVIIKGCGHCPMIERPEETAHHYLEFLSSLSL